MKNKMNKKGDIPLTILVLGVVVICIIAIVSFYSSSQKVKNSFDIDAVREAKLIGEKINVYENLGWSQSEIDSILGIKIEGQTRYVLINRSSISVQYNLPR